MNVEFINETTKDTIILGESNAYKKIGLSFDEDHECFCDMEFHDGYAVDDTHPQYIMTYPTIEEVKKSKRRTERIIDYTGRDCITPFDVALVYGVMKLKEK